MTLYRPFAAVFTVQSILKPTSMNWKFGSPVLAAPDTMGTCVPDRTDAWLPFAVARSMKGRLLVFFSPGGCCSYRDRTTWTLTTGPFSGSAAFSCASATLASSGRTAMQNKIRYVVIIISQFYWPAGTSHSIGSIVTGAGGGNGSTTASGVRNCLTSG